MSIRTIEDGFEYQVREILKGFITDYGDYVADVNGDGLTPSSFADWLHSQESAALGQAFIERVVNYSGEEIFNESLGQ